MAPYPGADQPLRLFLALWPSPEDVDRIRCLQGAAGLPATAKLTRPERLHMTLHFLGMQPGSLVRELIRSLAPPAGPVTVQFDGLDLWHGDIEVLTASETPAALRRLHQDTGAALAHAGAMPAEGPYRPHITLARRAQGLVPVAHFPEPLECTFRGYSLVQSLPGEYRKLHSF